MDVGGWLRSLGLWQYEAAFRANEIDDEVLPDLTAEDLKELGVSAPTAPCAESLLSGPPGRRPTHPASGPYRVALWSAGWPGRPPRPSPARRLGKLYD
jgi:hypothetical protein